MTHPFLEALKKKPLLCDGAMGTLLYSRGASPEACFEQLNVAKQDVVQQVHIDYINAGADVIETNSFCGNRYRLQAYGKEADVWQFNVWAAKVARNAREIAGLPVFVAGSVGPTGKLLAPIGDVTKKDLEVAFTEQMEGLLAGGVDLFMIESMSSPVEAAVAVRAARKLSKLPVVAQFSFTTEGNTIFGTKPEDAVRFLMDLGDERPDVIGINCGAGPGPVLESLQRLASELSKHGFKPDQLPLSCSPNAGLPGREGTRFLYISRPDYCATFVDPYIEAGARLIGGCCGTTPEHIKLMRTALDKYIESHDTAARKFPATAGDELQQLASSSASIRVTVQDTHPSESTTAKDPPIFEGIAARLATNDRSNFFVSVELDPPKGAIPRKLLQAAQMVKDAGADTINVGDSPMAKVRMSSMATCLLIQQKIGIETIIHFTTRDRNLMGIQADLLGCQGLGVRNVIAVYDVDSVGLIKIISQLNKGLDIGGNSIGTPTSLTIACALNPTAENRKLEIERLKKKIDAGAHLIMTQPLYQLSDLTDFLDDFGDVHIPILAGIMPLHSFKHAEYLHNEVPGITIPDHVRAQMEKGGDEAARIGVELSEELIEELRPLIAGIYAVPSFGRYDDLCAMVRRLKAEAQQPVSPRKS
jgi:methionine synthase / methylenetetrahydrofolate reductase(NADPH)